jgi:acyl-ACP thioesterase
MSGDGSGSAVRSAGIWSEDVKIHAYDVDARELATLESLSRAFLEAAWNHAEALGVGYARLAEQGKLWVLSRLRMEIRQAPRWGDRLRVETWPRAARSAFAMRDFEMFDASGRLAAAGTSAWLVLDMESRKPQRVDKLLASFGSCPERRALAVEPEKLLPDSGEALLAERAAQYSDVDVNRHVNSARYIAWLLDAYPLDFLHTHLPVSLEMNYVGETHAGDAVQVLGREAGPGEFQHRIVRKSGSEAIRARIVWKPS